MKVTAILYPSGLKPPSAGATRGDLQVELNERLSQALVESGQQPAEEQTTTATREPRSVVSIDDNMKFLSLLNPA